MRQFTICMRKYGYSCFRKYNESLLGMPACRPETDTEQSPGYSSITPVPGWRYASRGLFCKGVTFVLPTIDVEATARRIDSRRIENNLSVRDLQSVFGFSSPQAVYGWIRAKSVPSVDNLIVLASVLHMTLDDLIITTD